MLLSSDIMVVSKDSDTSGQVKVFDAVTQQHIFTLNPENGNFNGGICVAAADVTGDGISDVLTSTGPGLNTVRVFDGTNGNLIRTITPFNNSESNGVFVAAVDTDGDGDTDIVTGSGPGEGKVRVFDVAGRTVESAFSPFGNGFDKGLFVAADAPGEGTIGVFIIEGPVVSLSVLESTTTEGSTTAASFRVSRDDATGILYVSGTVGGSAGLDTDYKVDPVGYYDNRARIYSPFLGRFISNDQMRFAAGDLNLYRYVANSPVSRVDPSGLAAPPTDPRPQVGAFLLGTDQTVGQNPVTVIEQLYRDYTGQAGKDKFLGTVPGLLAFSINPNTATQQAYTFLSTKVPLGPLKCSSQPFDIHLFGYSRCRPCHSCRAKTVQRLQGVGQSAFPGSGRSSDDKRPRQCQPSDSGESPQCAGECPGFVGGREAKARGGTRYGKSLLAGAATRTDAL